MAQETAFENGRISNSEGLVTLTLDRVILHNVCIAHRPLPTCQISLKSEKTFCGRTDIHIYVRMENGFIRSTLSSRPKNHSKHLKKTSIQKHNRNSKTKQTAWAFGTDACRVFALSQKQHPAYKILL